jgi:hypothetical protein
VKAFLKGYFPMHEPLHLRDFGRFEMNKRRLGRQRENQQFKCPLKLHNFSIAVIVNIDNHNGLPVLSYILQ